MAVRPEPMFHGERFSTLPFPNCTLACCVTTETTVEIHPRLLAKSVLRVGLVFTTPVNCTHSYGSASVLLAAWFFLAFSLQVIAMPG